MYYLLSNPNLSQNCFHIYPRPRPIASLTTCFAPSYLIKPNFILFYFVYRSAEYPHHTTPHHTTPHHTPRHHTTPHPLTATAQNCLPHILAIFSCKSHSSNYFFHNDFILHQTQLDEIYRYCTILY